MSRYDVRWIWRHPLRWLRVMWLPWALAAVLAAKAVIVTETVFAQIIAANVWPIILGALAGVVAASALAPLAARLQAFSASAVFGVAILRLAAYVDVLVRGDLGSSGQTLAIAFASHWALVAVIAPALPVLLESAGRAMAVESGQDDRGHN